MSDDEGLRPVEDYSEEELRALEPSLPRHEPRYYLRFAPLAVLLLVGLGILIWG
ncbi:MAG: hypothetical protein FWG11_03590 [Promicromonosporaceae bacterium]|nr:hypothetical protein [Promicromonosporaceae bacterium]